MATINAKTMLTIIDADAKFTWSLFLLEADESVSSGLFSLYNQN